MATVFHCRLSISYEHGPEQGGSRDSVFELILPLGNGFHHADVQRMRDARHGVRQQTRRQGPEGRSREIHPFDCRLFQQS